MKAVVASYGQVGKNVSFAVKIENAFGVTHERVVPLKTKSKYQAEVAAIKYVCQAIPHKDVNLEVKVSVTQIPQIFKKVDGKFIKRKRPNKLVDSTRELASKFESFVCSYDKDSAEMAILKEKAKLPFSI